VGTARKDSEEAMYEAIELIRKCSAALNEARALLRKGRYAEARDALIMRLKEIVGG